MSTDLQIEDVPEEGLGPAMRRCTPLQRRFVLACLRIGSGNWTRAAGMAGYSGTEKALSVIGYRTSQLDYVRAAILEMAASNLASHAIVAQATVLDIMTNERVDPKTRLRASEMVLDRVGMHSKTEHNVNVTHELGDRASMIAMLKAKVAANPALLAQYPEPIQKLIGPVTVDVECVEVDEELEAMLR